MLSALWPKKVLIETYLNIAPWGPGIFGAEAASRHFFHKSATELTRREAILLAGVLPSPSLRNPAQPTPQMLKVVPVIDKRMEILASRSACVLS
jgi:monofunctional biosynthetic peptidoglycan transglycosylase